MVLSGASDLETALAAILDESQGTAPVATGPVLGAAAGVAAPSEQHQLLGQEEDEMTQEELLRMFGLQSSIHKMQADGGEDRFWAAKS